MPHIAIIGSQILLLLTIACLRHKGIVCVLFMEMCWEKYFLIKDDIAWAHTESAVNAPFVTEQMAESVHQLVAILKR